MPNTISPRPSADRNGAEQIELDALLGRRVVHATSQHEDHRDDQHLPGEHPPPRGVGREEAADQRAQRGGDRTRGGDEPVGARALGLAEVRRDQRHDRGHDQHRAQALQARPADHQHRQVRRQRGRQRPAGVDDAADRERALAAEDLADLAAGDHQRRHHERVHRDRRLDPGHRRVEILGDRRDRRIHHRRVQGHHELARSQRQQDDAGRARSSSCSRRHRCSPRHPACSRVRWCYVPSNLTEHDMDGNGLFPRPACGR